MATLRVAQRRFAFIARAAAFLLLSLAASRLEAVQPGLFAYVPNQSTNNVRVYITDAAGALTAVATIPVGVQPKEAIVRADHAYAYVGNNVGTISVISTATQTVIQTIGAGAFPWGMAFNPDNTRLYVANRNGDTISVFSVDPATGLLALVTTFGSAGGPLALAVTPDGTRLYSANTTNNVVRVYDTSTNAAVTSIAVGSAPLDVVLDPAGARAYVPNFSNNTVSVIDIATNTVVATVPAGTGPSAVAVSRDGTRLYVLNSTAGTISQFETSTFSAIAPAIAAGGNNGFGLELTPDGSVLYATNDQFDAITTFSVGPGGVLSSLGSQPIGLGNSSPFGVGICSGGNNLLRTGLTFVARTAAAIGCMEPTPTFTGGTLQLAAAGLAITQPFVLGSGGGTIDTNGNDASFTGAFSGTDALTKAGAGTLTLSGLSTNSGSTAVSAGTLRAGAAGALSEFSAFVVGSGATLDLNGLHQSIGSLAGAGNVALGSGTLVSGVNGDTTTFSGVVSGSGAFAKTGAGTLTLSGTNTYTGATTVANGTLAVTGSASATSVVGVGSGATLAGTGTLGGSLNVNGTVAPGISGQGVLTTGALTFASVGTFAVDIAGPTPGSGHDQLNVTGAATLGNAVLVLNPSVAVTAGQPMTILSATGPVSGTFNGLPNGATFVAAGATYRVAYNASTVTLTRLDEQAITFGPLASQAFGTAPFTIGATASSGLTVTFSSLTPGVCTVSGTTVTLVAAGSCTIAADQAGDTAFNVAPQVTQGFTVTKANQTITFGALAPRTLGTAPFAVGATASSGLSVTFSSLTASVCTVAGSTVTLVSGGTCTLAANQAGNGNFNAAPQVTQGFTVVDPLDTPRLVNISARNLVQSGTDNALIGGFVIGGPEPKTVAVVASGPSLADYGIANPLADPRITLVRSSDRSVVATNDNWQSAANASQLQAAGFSPSQASEAAILATLPPGAYTAVVEGAQGGTGVAVVGVYEVDAPQVPLLNFSTRGLVLTGNDVLIGGFVVGGSGPQTVAIVATGPSLNNYGVFNPLQNPTIKLVRASDQAVIASNDDWQSHPNAAQLQSSGFAPSHPLESGIHATLPPGMYTVVVQGVGGGTGVALLGVYKAN